MLHSLRGRISAHGPWPRRGLALTCLLLAAAAALPGAGSARSASARSVPVVVARGALDAGRVLTARDLAVLRYPAGLAPPGAARSVARVTGRRLAAPVGVDEPLTPQRLLGRELTARLPPGWVAVTVAVADADAAQFVHPGDLVDLVPVGDGATGDGAASESGTGTGAATNAATVAEAIRVLAVLPAAAGDPASDAAGGVAQPQAVLAADRRTAVRVAAARGIGPFTLLVRGP